MLCDIVSWAVQRKVHSKNRHGYQRFIEVCPFVPHLSNAGFRVYLPKPYCHFVQHLSKAGFPVDVTVSCVGDTPKSIVSVISRDTLFPTRLRASLFRISLLMVETQ